MLLQTVQLCIANKGKLLIHLRLTLEKIGPGTLIGRFQEERIEPEIVLAMTDGELT